MPEPDAYVFTGQSEHSVAPVDAAIEPAGQDVHEEACAAENLPLAHATHLEAPLAEEIALCCPEAIDLCGKTELEDIAVLARNAAGAVGNDTGPTHIAAAAGCQTVVLFSDASDPALTAPRGASVAVLRQKNLSDLSIESVAAALRLG